VIELRTVADITTLRESCSVECKLAAGRDGMGAISDEFWTTYSAFANSDGGLIILGVREVPKGFDVAGIGNPGKLRQQLFESANNRQKVSVNLLTNTSVNEATIDGRTLVVVEIPRATREQRPVPASQRGGLPPRRVIGATDDCRAGRTFARWSRSAGFRHE
jgi:ATP-dependent DNA helicase RecG